MFHADEPDEDDTPDEIRREELIELVLAEAEAGDFDGARQVRVYGCGERKGKVIWRCPVWLMGETLGTLTTTATEAYYWKIGEVYFY